MAKLKEYKLIENKLKKINFKIIIDYIIVILLIFLSIKKGGFYTSDTILFNLCIIGIAFIYLIYFVLKTKTDNEINIEKNNKSNDKVNCKSNEFNKVEKVDNLKNKIKKYDFIEILLLLLALAYSLPILFNTYSNLSDSIFEIIRIINIYIIYNIVKKSDNKRIYIIGIIIVALLQCFIGIDGLGNRYLESILNLFKSGFLDKDFTRLSGTIQYANNLAIIVLISFMFVLDNFFKNSNKYKYICLSIFLSSIILTGSRMVLVITILALTIYTLKNKENLKEKLILYFILFTTSFIYITILSNYILINPKYVYLIFIVFILINYIIGKLYIKYICNNEIKDGQSNFDKKNKIIKKCLVVFIVTFCTYIFVGVFISKPLVIFSNTKDDKISQNIYGIKENTDNTLQFDIKELVADSRYEIVVYEVDNNYESKVIKHYQYYETVSGKFSFDFIASNNSKYTNIYIRCYKGEISVDNVKLNDKLNILNYKLLPSEFINRIKDSIYGSTSLRDRIEYTKDSFKILTKSPQIFIFGTGGEGFKNLYKTVQTLKYNSTEVHNTYLQIFVESGLIGFIIIISIIIYSLKTSKKDLNSLAYFMFLIYSLFDISFSYMLSQAIFAILLGSLNSVDEKKHLKS